MGIFQAFCQQTLSQVSKKRCWMVTFPLMELFLPRMCIYERGRAKEVVKYCIEIPYYAFLPPEPSWYNPNRWSANHATYTEDSHDPWPDECHLCCGHGTVCLALRWGDRVWDDIGVISCRWYRANSLVTILDPIHDKLLWSINDSRVVAMLEGRAKGTSKDGASQTEVQTLKRKIVEKYP